jgi:hypothetical protein
MKDEKIDTEEVWSAIRYLNPDEGEGQRSQCATVMAILALLLIIGGVWILLWLRIEQP